MDLDVSLWLVDKRRQKLSSFSLGGVLSGVEILLRKLSILSLRDSMGFWSSSAAVSSKEGSFLATIVLLRSLLSESDVDSREPSSSLSSGAPSDP